MPVVTLSDVRVRPPVSRDYRARALGRAVVTACAIAIVGAAAVAARSDAAVEGQSQRQARAAIVKQLPAALSRARMRQDLVALERISDRNGGSRAAGTPGYAASVRYVQAQLRRAGYKPQTSAFPYTSYVERLERGQQIEPVQRELPLEALEYSPSTPAGGLEARLLASGDGCERGDFDPVRGPYIALVERGACFFRVKAANAQGAGAVAVLVYNSEPGPFDGTLGGPDASAIPVAGISQSLGRELAGTASAIVRLELATETRRATSRNVTADSAPGAARVLIVGAHLDSVSAGAGINDNATGVATVLEIARALRKGSRPLAVRLAFWGAEELGLFGSRAYASTVRRTSVAGYLNLDVLGSPTQRYGVYGSDRFAPRLVSYLARRKDTVRVDIGGRSDHAPFAQRGIPVAGLYAGDYDCYHRQCDRLAAVDFDVLSDLAAAAAFGVASFAPMTARAG